MAPVGAPAGRRLAPFRRVEKRPFRGRLTVRRRLGFAAAPVSRLFGRRVCRCADSVLMADDDRTRCRAVLELPRITRLKGRGDAALPASLPERCQRWCDVVARLNRGLRGWANYFSYGTRLMAYRAVDNYVYACARHYLRRRHKVPTRGTRRFPAEQVFGPLGVVRLRPLHVGRGSCASA
jgi:hypothetical protein